MLCLALPASAAKLPDWAAAIAAEAPSADGVDGDWRVLLEETRVSVEPDGTLELRQRTAMQALDGGRGHDVAMGQFHFLSTSRIRNARGWHLSPEGKVYRSKLAVDLTPDTNFLTDRRARFLPLDEIERGSLAFFEFEAREHPETLSFAHTFVSAEPVDRARLRAEVPPGWKVLHDWTRGTGPAPEVEDSAWVFELSGLDELEDDPAPLAPSPGEAVPWIVLSFVPPDGHAAPERSVVVEDWPALAAWYAALAAESEEVTDEIRRTVDGLSPSTDGTFFDAIRRLGVFVRDQVRYVDKEIGIGRYQPRPAETVLHEKLGDCKDKATLLLSMLGAAGIESYPLLVNATRSGTVSPSVPAQSSFNHLILAARVGEGPVPSDFAASMVEVDGLGRLAVLDTTDAYTSIGRLPAYLAGKRALLVADEHSQVITLPDGDPEAHRVERKLEIRIAEGVEMREEVVRFGEPASSSRSVWSQSSRAYLDASAGDVARRWPGARIVEHDAVPEDGRGAFVESMLRRDDRSMSNGGLRLFPGVLDDLPRVSVKQRDEPVVYDFVRTLRCETVVHGMAGHPLPRATDTAGDGWSVRTAYDREGDTVTASFELKLSRRRFEPAEFDELRRFWDEARAAAAARLF